MPTHEEILNLPKEGWEKIGAMNDEELAVFLKDVTILEPTIPESSEPNRVFLEKEIDEENKEASDNNPFKKKTKTTSLKKKFSDAEKDAIMKSLLDGLE